MILVLIASLFIALILSYTLFFIFGAPYDPTTKSKQKTISKIIKLFKSKNIAELGSGDGRLAIKIANNNPKTIIDCYEINPLLVLMSKRNIKKANLNKTIKVHYQNFWKINLNKYDSIVLFQFPHIMNKLEKKIKKECKRSTKIISNHWKFKNLKEIKSVNDVMVYEV
jgi:tRNA1(Val) A37 N6-methylase TrmN6